MRTKTLQTVAVALGLGACTVAYAENPYEAPSKWTNFRSVADTVENVPAPTAELPVPTPAQPMPSTPVPSADPIGTGTSPYSEAMSAPWSGSESIGEACGSYVPPVRPPLYPWFGGADLLFYTLETDRGSALAYDGTNVTNLWSSAVDPESSVGFDVFAGRYFDCGRYGLGLGYMMWNPGTSR